MSLLFWKALQRVPTRTVETVKVDIKWKFLQSSENMDKINYFVDDLSLCLIPQSLEFEMLNMCLLRKIRSSAWLVIKNTIEKVFVKVSVNWLFIQKQFLLKIYCQYWYSITLGSMYNSKNT